MNACKHIYRNIAPRHLITTPHSTLSPHHLHDFPRLSHPTERSQADSATTVDSVCYSHVVCGLLPASFRSFVPSSCFPFARRPFCLSSFPARPPPLGRSFPPPYGCLFRPLFSLLFFVLSSLLPPGPACLTGRSLVPLPLPRVVRSVLSAPPPSFLSVSSSSPLGRGVRPGRPARLHPRAPFTAMMPVHVSGIDQPDTHLPRGSCERELRSFVPSAPHPPSRSFRPVLLPLADVRLGN